MKLNLRRDLILFRNNINHSLRTELYNAVLQSKEPLDICDSPAGGDLENHPGGCGHDRPGRGCRGCVMVACLVAKRGRRVIDLALAPGTARAIPACRITIFRNFCPQNTYNAAALICSNLAAPARRLAFSPGSIQNATVQNIPEDENSISPAETPTMPRGDVRCCRHTCKSSLARSVLRFFPGIPRIPQKGQRECNIQRSIRCLFQSRDKQFPPWNGKYGPSYPVAAARACTS